MTQYSVTAKRWAHGWELHIDGVGVTQCRSLGEAEAMVRDYLAIDDVPDAATAKVDIRVDPSRYVVTADTPDGGDVDLDRDVVLDAHGNRITEATTLAFTNARARGDDPDR